MSDPAFTQALRALDDALAAGLWPEAAEITATLRAHAADATPAERQRARQLTRRAEHWLRQQQELVVGSMLELVTLGDQAVRGQFVDIEA